MGMGSFPVGASIARPFVQTCAAAADGQWPPLHEIATRDGWQFHGYVRFVTDNGARSVPKDFLYSAQSLRRWDADANPRNSVLRGAQDDSRQSQQYWGFFPQFPGCRQRSHRMCRSAVPRPDLSAKEV